MFFFECYYMRLMRLIVGLVLVIGVSALLALTSHISVMLKDWKV